MTENKILNHSYIQTPLGQMIAISDKSALYLLEFVDCSNLERKIKNLTLKTKFVITEGRTEPISSIEAEINLYFKGELKEFKTPILFHGTEFQKKVWQELKKIPYGQTRSYLDIAIAIGKPKSFRTVAQANGANKLPIIVPCHRVINNNGCLGGYSGGLWRKERLIKKEVSGI